MRPIIEQCRIDPCQTHTFLTLADDGRHFPNAIKEGLPNDTGGDRLPPTQQCVPLESWRLTESQEDLIEWCYQYRMVSCIEAVKQRVVMGDDFIKPESPAISRHVPVCH